MTRPIMPFIATGTPLLMRPDEVVTLKEAAHHASRSLDTVRRWVVQYGIGRQIGSGGRVEISALGLEMVLHGDWEALSDLRGGLRNSEKVQRYIEHLGLPT